MGQRKCLNAAQGACQGPVEGRPSAAGTGTLIYRCTAHARAAQKQAEAIRSRYPDSPNPPGWFDPTTAGESWDESY